MLEEKSYKDEKQKEELFNKIQFYDQTQKELVLYLKNFQKTVNKLN